MVKTIICFWIGLEKKYKIKFAQGKKSWSQRKKTQPFPSENQMITALDKQMIAI